MNANSAAKTKGTGSFLRVLSTFSRNYAIVIAILILGIIFTFASEYFLSFNNLRNITIQASALAIVAIGQAMILITGDFDLSLGQIVCFTSCFAAWMMKMQGAPVLLSVFVALGFGLLMGAINGFLIAYCRIPAFVATLGMQLIGMGLARIITNASPIPSMPESIEWLGRGFIGGAQWGFPISVAIMIGLYVLFAFIARRTRLGRNIYAIGGSMEAAYFAGINVKKNKLIVFSLGGGISAFGGLVLLSRLDSAAVTNGNLYEFDAIISCVIGGISLTGGKGKILQALFGALFLTLFFNGMTMLNVDPFIQTPLKGVVLIGAVAIDVLRNRKRQ